MKAFVQIVYCYAFAIFLFGCNNKSDNKKEAVKEKKLYAAGDRLGADTTIVKDLAASWSIPELVCQRWDNADDNEVAMYATSSSSNIPYKGLQTPMRSFYFFKDGSVVKDSRDNIMFGNWAYDDIVKTISITLESGAKEKYQVKGVKFNKMALQKEDEKKPVVYIADGFVTKQLNDDPFYKINLQWRVRSKASEDDTAIRKRLKGCLHFYYLFYLDNSNRNSKLISFYGLPGPFKWYAGGIHLKKEKDLDGDWLNIFYNQTNLSQAYIILDKMISQKYKWDEKETNWIKQNAGVLKQMEQKIDSL